jgi:hypothetical protein
MGVLQPRARRDSRASALSHRNWGFDRDADFSVQSSSLVEHANANLGSSPGAGMEPSSYNSSSLRTPSRSFVHRSFNTPTGMFHSKPFPKDLITVVIPPHVFFPSSLNAPERFTDHLKFLQTRLTMPQIVSGNRLRSWLPTVYP